MKKFFKILLRCFLLAVAAVVFVSGIVLICAWRRSQNDYWTDSRLSENVSVRWYYKKQEYRIYNYSEKKIVAKSLDRVVKPAEDDSLTVFFRQGLRGYLNANTGEVVIPEQYLRAWVFSEGLAAVVDGSGKVGFINKDNEVVVPFVYPYDSKKSIDYLFQGGLCAMIDEQGMCGLIDATGHWVVEPVYDYIWSPKHGKYRVVKQDGKYGLLEENLDLLFPIVYDNIEVAWEEADGLLISKDGIMQQVTFDGTVIQPFVVDEVGHIYCLQSIDPVVLTNGYDNSEILKTEDMLLSDYMLYRVNGCCGVMHHETGKVIIPALYNDIEMPSPTIFEATLSGVNTKKILFDINGNRID